MSGNHADLVRERLELQKKLRQHFAENFDYGEYLDPPPDSWMAQYRKRIAEIDAVLAPELQYWKPASSQ